MCGIVAIYSYNQNALPIDHDELISIRDHMEDRGPDAAGAWFSTDKRVALGHRRLSIIDLSDEANQPMVNAEGDLVITYNGEIYNYKELRDELEKKGYQFRTKSDTEVLLHLYHEQKEKMVHRLRGMFAFAIWDQNKNSLFLARDPYGIKPLYYSDDGLIFRAASQVKALLAGGKILSDIDPAGIAGFYLLGSVPEPYTIYSQIRTVPAGTYCWVNQSGVSSSIPYFSLANIYCDAEMNLKKFNAENEQVLHQSLQNSVRAHLVSDVPVGLFLSSGLDSSTLLGLMCDLGYKQPKTITLAFKEFEGQYNDESNIAKEIASHYGTQHVTRIVSFEEFKQDWPFILEKMDQPSIDGVNSWFVCKAAKEQGLKVAISGLGGDELFGGYPSFQRIPRLVRMLSLPSLIPFFPSLFRKGMQLLFQCGLSVHPKSVWLLDNTSTYMGAYLLQRGLFLPSELKRFLNAELIIEGIKKLDPIHHVQSYLEPKPKHAFSKIATLESSLYMRNQLLRDTDWASMAHSVEVRTPFVDSFLVKQIAPILCGKKIKTKKEILMNVPKQSLPKVVLDIPKKGFATPFAEWISTLYQNKWYKSEHDSLSSRKLADLIAKQYIEKYS